MAFSFRGPPFSQQTCHSLQFAAKYLSSHFHRFAAAFLPSSFPGHVCLPPPLLVSSISGRSLPPTYLTKGCAVPQYSPPFFPFAFVPPSATFQSPFLRDVNSFLNLCPTPPLKLPSPDQNSNYLPPMPPLLFFPSHYLKCLPLPTPPSFPQTCQSSFLPANLVHFHKRLKVSTNTFPHALLSFSPFRAFFPLSFAVLFSGNLKAAFLLNPDFSFARDFTMTVYPVIADVPRPV